MDSAADRIAALEAGGTLARLGAAGFVLVEKRWLPLINALSQLPLEEITPDMVDVYLRRRPAA